MVRIGSLFDGSGGFPLAASFLGMEPVWASEIEPLPIRVTRSRLPDMQHLGDITKLDGSKIPTVDIVTFGSPCTDLSIAGGRAGITGKQSSLFFEAVRVITEMRTHTLSFPRVAVWENVTGALSSNQGRDFQAVLNALIRVKNPEAPSVPLPKRWPNAGCVLAAGVSVAWRVLDAQYFGTPQRRRRVFLVADFGGYAAADAVFEREGVSRDYLPPHLTPAAAPLPGRVDAATTRAGRRIYTVGLAGAGVYGHAAEIGVCRTLDCAGPAPTSNQGGTVVLENGGLRTLSPEECGRLQGFPPGWAANLTGTSKSPDDVVYWLQVWDEWNKSRGVRPPSARQVARWLDKPPAKTGLYKMWGNGVSLPCVMYVLQGVKEIFK